MVEQGTHKPLVGGSNPPSATNLIGTARPLAPPRGPPATGSGDILRRLADRVEQARGECGGVISGGFARNFDDRPGVKGVVCCEEDLSSAVAAKLLAGG